MARKTGSHSQITGPLVRQAALRLFAQGGYAAVSMRQIASEVGLQAGALYLYTPDKQTLLFTLMHEHLEELLTAWEAVEKPVAPIEQLQAFTRFHIRFHLERLDAVFIANMELRNLSDENFAVIEKLRKAYEDGLQSILEAGHATGAFRVPDLKLATLAIIAMLTGVNTWYREGGRLSRDRVERIYWNMVRRSVGA
ncbi:MAG: TetR/AcrR family transcriptional regulator [Marinosulfonomonas sp.]|nr:TetR/AcrR family transcriptional regulator [Marinosulfonomonas sp.]